MNRRYFLGVVTAALGAAAVPSAELIPNRRERIKYAAYPPVELANGKGYIMGVATQDVKAGDWVQIQVYGPAMVNARV